MSAVHVLLVDDSDVFRRTLAETLADLLEATVSEAADGEEALRRLESAADVDLVLVDMRMPRMDGLELSRRILDRPRPPHVIVVTAFDERSHADQAARAGVDGFFCKTDGIAALLAEIERVTGGTSG